MINCNISRHNKTIGADGTSMRIGCRFAFVKVFQPRMNDDGSKGKYSACILIPKTDTATYNMVKAGIDSAIAAGVSTKWGGRKPVNLHTPLRDGDAEHPGDPSFEGMWFMNATSARQPGIQVKEKGQMPVDAFDEGDFYSGCWGAATIAFGAYDNSGNRGIACYLNNVCKTDDDDRFSGGRTAAEDFNDLAD